MYNDLASSLLGRCVKARCWLPKKREKGRTKRNDSGWISVVSERTSGRERERKGKAEERQK